MSVPSWLKLTAVTGSECAGSTFIDLPMQANKGQELLSRMQPTSCNVPHSNGLVISTRNKEVWLGVVINTKDEIGMPIQGLDGLSL